MVTLGRIPLIGLLLLLLHGIPLATKSIAFSRNTFASRAHGQRFLEKNTEPSNGNKSLHSSGIAADRGWRFRSRGLRR